VNVNGNVVGPVGRPYRAFDSDFGQGRGAFERYRDAVADVCGVSSSDETESFYVPLIISPDSAHCAVINAQSAIGTVLSEHLTSFLGHAESMTDAEVASQIDVLTGLLAAAFDPTADGAMSARQMLRTSSLALAKRFIERHLTSPQLSSSLICRRFGWSRATLYRLFEVDGDCITTFRGAVCSTHCAH
jgi:hypothetical protein